MQNICIIFYVCKKIQTSFHVIYFMYMFSTIDMSESNSNFNVNMTFNCTIPGLSITCKITRSTVCKLIMSDH